MASGIMRIIRKVKSKLNSTSRTYKVKAINSLSLFIKAGFWKIFKLRLSMDSMNQA